MRWRISGSSLERSRTPPARRMRGGGVAGTMVPGVLRISWLSVATTVKACEEHQDDNKQSIRRGRYLLRWVEYAAEVGGAHDGADLEPLGAGDGRVGHGAARVLVQLHAHAQRGALVGRPVEGALRGAHVVGEVVAGGRRAVGVDELVAADAALDRGLPQLISNDAL